MNSIHSVKFELADGITVDFDQITKGTYAELNGIKLTAIDEGFVEGKIEIQKHHLNPNGILHGGVTTTLADTIAIFGCAYIYKTPNIATINLNATYVRPVKLGIITARCHILTKGKNVSTWKVELVNGSDDLFAEVSVTFSISI